MLLGTRRPHPVPLAGDAVTHGVDVQADLRFGGGEELDSLNHHQDFFAHTPNTNRPPPVIGVTHPIKDLGELASGKAVAADDLGVQGFEHLGFVHGCLLGRGLRRQLRQAHEHAAGSGSQA
ncbi:hypothetical protein CCP4SC76_2100009 [Gammaproteobacteria bacterium]